MLSKMLVLKAIHLSIIQETETGSVKFNNQLWNLLIDLLPCYPVRPSQTNPLDQKASGQSVFGLIGGTKDLLCFQASGKSLTLGLKRCYKFVLNF